MEIMILSMRSLSPRTLAFYIEVLRFNVSVTFNTNSFYSCVRLITKAYLNLQSSSLIE